MAAKLAATVYVRDPDTHQTVELAEGTCPEDRLASLVTSPKAWIDGKLPRLKTAQSPANGDQDPTDVQGGASGGDSDDSATGNPPPDEGDDQAAPAAKKTAARKTAATGRSRGRDADGKGDIGD
jgi:hypothetical protein